VLLQTGRHFLGAAILLVAIALMRAGFRKAGMRVGRAERIAERQ
jgi:hypothetical protein